MQWGRSSTGRAFDWQSKGRRFDPARLHFFLGTCVCKCLNFYWRSKSILYFSAVRITIIGALGGIVAFCLRMLRAHMHMAQHNQHRQRVANSIAAFVESAATPEQRDLILSQLVDSIAHFGSSGILRKEDESIQVPKVVVDNLSRTITSPQTPPRQ